MKKLILILLLCLITSSAFGQWSGIKPLLGEQINWAHPLSKGLKFFMLGNEGTGSQVFDLSGNGNTGNLVNDTHWVPGKFGSALSFDGTGDYIIAPHKGMNKDIGTLVVFFKLDVTSGDASNEFIFDSDTARHAVWVNNNILAMYNDGRQTTFSVSWGASEWHQGIFVWNKTGNIQQFYLDGINQTGQAPTGTWGSNNIGTNIYLGSNAAKSAAFIGDFEYALLYNRALSASEIALLYREPFCMFEVDDIAMMQAAIPVAAGGQIIVIIMSALPFLVFPAFILIKRRKCE
jgi:hypothetical protein